MADKIRYKNGSVYENGYGNIPKKVMTDTKLHIEAKAIYAYLVSYTGAGKTAFPPVDMIIRHLQISKTRFYKYQEELVRQGYITITREKHNGKFAHNVYTIEDVPCPQIEDTEIEDTVFKDTNKNTLNSNTFNNNTNNVDNGQKSNDILTKPLSLSQFTKAYGKNNIEPESLECVEFYLKEYKAHRNKHHPLLKFDQWKRVFRFMRYLDIIGEDVDVETMRGIITHHFNTKYENCDYSLLHFITGDIKTNRYYEWDRMIKKEG